MKEQDPGNLGIYEVAVVVGRGRGTGGREQQGAGTLGWDTDWLCGGPSVPGGKRDEELILPINSSLSVTLHQDQVSMG